MEEQKQVIVVNLLGGPGTGKTILASEVFAKLKRNFVKCDISHEYIKRKLREQATKVVQNQIYIFGKQQFQLFSMKDSVDVIITDSPLVFSAIYDTTACPELKAIILKEFRKYKNLNYYLKRNDNVPYEEEGRYQDLTGAKLVDDKVKVFLDENQISHMEIIGIGENSLEQIVNDVMKELGK